MENTKENSFEVVSKKLGIRSNTLVALASLVTASPTRLAYVNALAEIEAKLGDVDGSTFVLVSYELDETVKANASRIPDLYGEIDTSVRGLFPNLKREALAYLAKTL